MRGKAWKWALALAFSGALHTGAAGFLLMRKEPAEIAGGQSIEMAVAGSAFTDLSAAGAPSETVEPVSEPAAEITPVQPEMNTAEPIVSPDQATVDVPTTPATEPPATQPSNELENAQQAETNALEPVQPQETVTAMVDIPRPTPRPNYVPPPEPAPAQTTQQQIARKTTSGSGGQDSRDAKRGSASDASTASTGASSSRSAARASTTGNAEVSNYPGKVVSRLRRALRYPREAQRERLRGEVHVAFTITSSGGVSGIRVVGSSGSSVLDQAAIDTVRRAAPFPSIPSGAGRSSWPFTVPLAFVR